MTLDDFSGLVSTLIIGVTLAIYAISNLLFESAIDVLDSLIRAVTV